MAAEPIPENGKGKPFIAVPIQEPIKAEGDSAPKRRGRPPGSRNDATPGTKRPGRKPRSLEPRIGAALVMANLPLMMFASGDALDDGEIAALASALDAQAQNNPAFRKYLMMALDASSGGQLITVGGVIIARRMARHSFLLPKEADAQLGKLFNSGAMPKPEPVAEPEQESVEQTES